MTDTPLDPSLRTVSDTFMEQLERLSELEERKRSVPVDDDAFPALARAVEDAAQALLDRAAQQTARADAVHGEAVAAGVSATIEDIPADLTPTGILALWREAERELETTQPGTERHGELTRRATSLRMAYQAAYREQRNAR